jgi:hypothetical protein
MGTVQDRRPWSLERRAWMLAFLISAFSSLLMHVSPTEGSYWPKACGDLFVGLSLVMVFAGGRENGYGERGTLPLAVGVGLLAPVVGYAFDPGGPLATVFGALEFFVVGMAIAGSLIALNRRFAPEDAPPREGPTD